MTYTYPYKSNNLVTSKQGNRNQTMQTFMFSIYFRFNWVGIELWESKYSAFNTILEGPKVAKVF